jgi:hypothetical protein
MSETKCAVTQDGGKDLFGGALLAIADKAAGPIRCNSWLYSFFSLFFFCHIERITLVLEPQTFQ